MSIAQYKKDIVRFVRDNNLSKQHEKQLNSILVRAYVSGSKDGILDMVLPQYDIKNAVNKNERVQQLNDQEYGNFYRWLTGEHIVEKYRDYAYDDVEKLICNLVFGDDIEIDSIQDNIVDDIINDYFEQ